MVPSFCWLVLGVCLAFSPGSIPGNCVSGLLAQLLHERASSPVWKRVVLSPDVGRGGRLLDS